MNILKRITDHQLQLIVNDIPMTATEILLREAYDEIARLCDHEAVLEIGLKAIAEFPQTDPSNMDATNLRAIAQRTLMNSDRQALKAKIKEGEK